MHPVLKKAIDTLGLKGKTPTLVKNAEFSRGVVKDSRQFLRKTVPDKDVPLDVVAVGSIAREESSIESDFDYLIIAHALPPKVTQSRDMISAIDPLLVNLGLKPPGRTRTFGRVISAADLTEFIGLEDDTNRSLTHRILILGESVSLYRPDLHKVLVRRIIERYLSDYKKPKAGVPRFLLNDGLRYWHTLTVDYQAKRWEQVKPDWGLRYLKLLISRKLAFVGFLVPLLLCKNATVDYFVSQFEMPPLARIAQLARGNRSLHKSLKTILKVSEEFARALSDETFRQEAEKVAAPDDKDKWPKRFKQIRARAYDLQEALEEMFFESALFGDKARKYISF